MNALANALIVVDTQVDFCPGGSLAVPNGDKVAAAINEYMTAKSGEYIVIVATKCWHPSLDDNPDFDHFSKEPNFVNTWPPHCVAGTEGANFHPNLGAMEQTSFRNMHGVRPSPIGDLFEFDKIFYKGQNAAAYSGFEGGDGGGQASPAMIAEVGHDPYSLDSYLGRHAIEHVDIVGIATDHCVFATAMDAKKLAYDTTVLLGMCAGVNETTTATAIEQMDKEGIHLDE